MSPKLQALKDALERFDKTPLYSCGHDDAQRALMVAINKAGFNPKKLAENWARYQVAVGEAADAVDQLGGTEEPEPESMELFG